MKKIKATKKTKSTTLWMSRDDRDETLNQIEDEVTLWSKKPITNKDLSGLKFYRGSGEHIELGISKFKKLFGRVPKYGECIEKIIK